MYVCLVVFMFLFQKRFLYVPGDTGREFAKHLQMECWPDATAFHGYLSQYVPETPRGTAMVWHGNAGTALDRGFYIDALGARGWRVLLMEYPGYGDRPGDLGETSFTADADAAVGAALDQFDGPFLFIGESMGNGVASAMLKRYGSRVTGMIMITPWASFPALAQAKFPFLPARWMVRDQYDNIANTADFPGPVAIVMAEYDEVIPNAHTLKLFDAMPEPRKLWTLKQSGHNTWPAGQHEPWWDEVLAFVAPEE